MDRLEFFVWAYSTVIICLLVFLTILIIEKFKELKYMFFEDRRTEKPQRPTGIVQTKRYSYGCCPICDHLVNSNKNKKICTHCGQRLSWPIFIHGKTKKKNGDRYAKPRME